MKPVIYSNFGFSLDKDFATSVEIWIDTFVNFPGYADKKIFIAMEPNEVSNVNELLMRSYYLFDYVLSYDEQLLNIIPNSILFEFGTTWVNMNDYLFTQKEFAISTVCGPKYFTTGHILRHLIWYNQSLINNPTRFYISKYGGVPNINNNPVLGESKYPLFDCMFHICIENVSKKYYFTEKLIDCFLTKTVPIYWGCTNIGNYFNTEGFFVAQDASQIIHFANSLTENDYYLRADAIEENYIRAQKWIDYNRRLIEKLGELHIK